MSLIKSIDLNCDLGEGYDDAAIMAYISSCNIACGGHCGNAETVEQSILLALTNHVAIGAHPAYPDKENFGRKSMDIELDQLTASISEQIERVYKTCEKHKTKLHHIKLHGALYNDTAQDMDLAIAIFRTIQAIVPDTLLYVLADSQASAAAQFLGMHYYNEVFADRAYESRSSLRSRKLAGAVISDWNMIRAQLDHYMSNQLSDYYGNLHTLSSDTICLHSDTAAAVTLAKNIHHYIHSKDVRISSDS